MKIDLSGKKIIYEIKGKGPTILLVHGWGGSSKSLEPLARILASEYKTIVLDLPGFGQSDNPNPDWGIEEYANFLIDFICRLKLRPVVYFGHSFGAALGIYLAANHPSYIKKLILSGASYKRNPSPTAKFSRPFRWLPPTLKILIYRSLFPNSDLYKTPHLEKNFRKIVSQDLTSCLPSIKAPTLILWGKDDRQTPVSDSQKLRQKIKNSKVKIFPQLGHNLPLVYPQAVSVEIKKFL